MDCPGLAVALKSNIMAKCSIHKTELQYSARNCEMGTSRKLKRMVKI